MGAHRDAFRLIGPLKRRQDKTWPSIAEDDGCYHDVQTIKAAGGKETRDRIGATLDEYAAHSAFGQLGEDCARSYAAVDEGQRDNLDAVHPRFSGIRSRDDQTTDAILDGHPRVCGRV